LGAQIQIAAPTSTTYSTSPPHIRIAQLTAPNLAEADAVVLLPEHTAFDHQLIERHSPYVLDCRARLNGPTIERL
jgi:UDP-N-acetyl-D-glucosamine dehydrogenase